MTSSINEHLVVIVDDNLQLLDLIAKSLSLLGNYRVMTADNGVAGLELVMLHQPQCVVIDVLMPGLDGYQLVRAIRGDPATAEIPLVILTAMVQDRDRFTGMAAGTDLYLAKPIEPLDLVAAIQQAVQTGQEDRHRRLQELAEAAEDKP